MRVAFDQRLRRDAREVLERMVLFASEDIERFRVLESEDGILGLEVDLARGSEGRDVARKLQTLARELREFRLPRPRTVWRSSRPPEAHEVTADLVGRGWLQRPGAGLATLAGPLVPLIRHLDSRLRRAIVARFGAEEHQYPTLIPSVVIRDCRYAETFPHLLILATRLHSDLDGYAWAREHAGRGDLDRLLELCDRVEFCLPPTMCFHSYHRLRGTEPAAQGGRCLTSVGKSFRFEAAYESGLERLFDFTIREVVFIGSRSFVREGREAMMELVFALIEELGLGARCQTAGDPFFAAADVAGRSASQFALEQKFELRAPVRPDGDVAVASFNLHGDFFARAFDLSGGTGSPVETACAGIGLERLVLAVVARHGVDTQRWPDALRKGVEEDRQ